MTKGDFVDYIRKQYEKSDGSDKAIVEIAKANSTSPTFIRYQMQLAIDKNDPWTLSKEEYVEAVAERKAIDDIISVIFDKYNLTDQQRLFCLYYTENFNPKIAAQKAGYDVDNRLQRKIAMLMSSKVITECIQEILNALTSNVSLTAEKIIERHMQIAFSNISDFVEYGVEEVDENVRDADGSIMDTVTISKAFVRPKDMSTVDGSLIKKIKLGQYGFEIELEDRSKSLDYLSKLLTLSKLEQARLDLDRHKATLDVAENPKTLADKVKQMSDKDLEVFMLELQSH